MRGKYTRFILNLSEFMRIGNLVRTVYFDTDDVCGGKKRFPYGAVRR